MTRANDSTGPISPGAVPRARWLPAGLELLVSAAALYGGVGLIWNNKIGMRDEWLTGTPFHSWTIPGLLLLLVVAAPMLSAAVLEVRRHPLAVHASILAGTAQIGWIAAQLAIMQRYNVQQPLMLGTGLLVLLTSVAVHRDQPHADGGRTGAAIGPGSDGPRRRKLTRP